MSYTPGPWNIQVCPYSTLGINAGTETKPYWIVNHVNGKSIEDPERLANAKLIAAAPELLEALLAMEYLDTLPHLSNKWWKQAEKCDELRRSAIKKATS